MYNKRNVCTGNKLGYCIIVLYKLHTVGKPTLEGLCSKETMYKQIVLLISAELWKCWSETKWRTH